jgi:hypothetical protein
MLLLWQVIKCFSDVLEVQMLVQYFSDDTNKHFRAHNSGLMCIV